MFWRAKFCDRRVLAVVRHWSLTGNFPLLAVSFSPFKVDSRVRRCALILPRASALKSALICASFSKRD